MSIRTVFVEYSGIAQIETVDVEDLSNNNSILITVSEQDYTYALNQGLFKSDSDTYQFQFTNVPAGIQTVKVKTLKTIVGLLN